METKTHEWIEATEAKIREAFDLFDRDKADAIIKEEVGTVMRALGCYPTERALVLEILPEVQDDEPTGFVRYVYVCT
jgi:Ca2+-binding EF-hand superfamily protein